MNQDISHDFNTTVAALRLTRVVNALTFCELARMSSRVHGDAAYGKFQQNHALWLTGGYLYEALRLINELAANFGSAYAFKDLMQVASSLAEFEPLLEDLSDNPSFTLDAGGTTTERICESCFTTNIKLAEARDGSNPRIPFYDETVELDSFWLLRQSEAYGKDAVRDFVNNGLDLYSKMFRIAAVKFLDTQILGMPPEASGIGD